MSLSSRFFTGALAVSAFAFAASAQDQTAKPKDTDAKSLRREMRHDGQRNGALGRHGERGAFGLRGITLTDSQKEQLKLIREANKPDRGLKDEMRTLHEAKRNGTLTTDQEARLKTLRDEARQKAESVHSQVLAILTPEQKSQLQERRQEMRQRMEQRRDQMQERRRQRDMNRTKDTTKVTTTEN